MAPAESSIELQDALLPVLAPSDKVEKALAKARRRPRRSAGGVTNLAARVSWRRRRESNPASG